MYAVITTEEYKELLEAEQMSKEFRKDFLDAVAELKEAREQLDNLLLFITKGAKKSQWMDGDFEGYDLADKDELAKYINKHFMKDGRLTVKENDNA
jgi:hypothetical protein